MSYPRTGNTGKVSSQRSVNPERARPGTTALPDGPTSSRVTRENSGPRPRPGGSQPDRTGGTGHTTSNAAGSPPDPQRVQSGPKITRISEP